MSFIRSKYRARTARSASGSVDSPRAVEPTTSQKRTVTVLRCSRAAGAGVTAAPHSAQNLAPSGRSWPQLTHVGTRPRLLQARSDHLSDLGRRRADLDAARLERFLLPGGRARGAGDDRARVAHRLAGRRGEAGDVREHRLRDVLGDVCRGLLLFVSADLADENDELRLGVGLEVRDDVDERRADDRVAADPDDCRVAEPELRELVADLVRQGPRAGDEPDASRGEDLGGDDPGVRL